MDKIIDVAAYIVAKYKEMTHETLDEMKLHKLLYFTQRESFAILGKPALRVILKDGNMVLYQEK